MRGATLANTCNIVQSGESRPGFLSTESARNVVRISARLGGNAIEDSAPSVFASDRGRCRASGRLPRRLGADLSRRGLCVSPWALSPAEPVTRGSLKVEVRKETARGAVVYRIRGQLNVFTSANLESALTINEGGSRVILDMREVTYVSSSGFRVIVQAAERARAAKGGVVVFGLQTLVKDVFDLSGLEKIIPNASDETEARSKLAV
jgi:anti-anti-sigma factor